MPFKKFLFNFLQFSKHRKDVSTGLKIMKRTPKFKEIRKVFPFDKIDFFGYVFSNVRRVLSQSNARLRLLYSLKE